MRLPAFWFEGDYHPARVRHGYFVTWNDDGEPVVEIIGEGRLALRMSHQLSLLVRCSACREWTQYVNFSGEHFWGCTAPPTG